MTKNRRMKMVEKIDNEAYTVYHALYELAKELDKQSKRISEVHNRIRKVEHRLNTIEGQRLQCSYNALFKDVRAIKMDIKQLNKATGLEKPFEDFIQKLVDSFTYHDDDSIYELKKGEDNGETE